MRKASIKREYSANYVIGELRFDDLYLKTLELPWLENKRSISCINEGIYIVEYRDSPTLGDVLHLKDVLGRTWIYIHKGNYTRQILGCILVGKSHADIDSDGIIDVTNSAESMGMLLAKFNETREPFELTIYS